ncbi:hypothetical protein DM02DRAFT_663409 [Periconia macrospinosa]|uniref:F-box domain-containing protein n=1 Tax=Periconia macrospinosa TaxID=97972 RepID=A0A2V1D1S6_9PLEO|nr:hypothetical protein DM02DRAFT_663409 [Periconia macrospinosa]
MSLKNLPAELLDIIVQLSLPEGFETLATTCKIFYARCEPFIQRHNGLRSRFRYFRYGNDGLYEYDGLWATSDFLQLIATDRAIARYIQNATLYTDSWSIGDPSRPSYVLRSVPSIEDGGLIVQSSS